MDDLDLLLFATPETIALCTDCRQTWWRWRTGRAKPPRAVFNLLRIVSHGELPHGGDAWNGWRFLRGRLIDPSGHEHTTGSISAWWWLAQELQALRHAENLSTPPRVRIGHALTAELHTRILQGEAA